MEVGDRGGWRSAQRCPEIQDVVIRQLRERENGKDQIVVEKGGGAYASGRTGSLFLFV